MSEKTFGHSILYQSYKFVECFVGYLEKSEERINYNKICKVTTANSCSFLSRYFGSIAKISKKNLGIFDKKIDKTLAKLLNPIKPDH